jgi:hypothetical protein
MKKYILLLITLLVFGCASHEPKNITNRVQYERDSNWCLNYNTPARTPVHTESYRQCMERLGYIYATP